MRDEHGRCTFADRGGHPRRWMDAPKQDLRLVEIRDEPRLRAIGCEKYYAFIYRTAQKAEALWRYLRIATNAVARVAPEPRATPSRIERRSMIVRRPLKAAARPAIGEGDLIICKCTRPVSFCTSASHGSRSPRGSQGKPPQKLSQRCSRCSAASIRTAKINHFRQRHRLRPARPAQDHARHHPPGSATLMPQTEAHRSQATP